MKLEKLIGRKVQWNKDEIAEIAEVFIHAESEGWIHHSPICYAIVERPCGMLVTKKIDDLKLLPKNDQ